MTPEAEPRPPLADDASIWQNVANATDSAHLRLVRAIVDLADELQTTVHAPVSARLREIASEHRDA